MGGEEMLTTRGIKIGDSLDKAEEAYGKPWSRIADLGLNPGAAILMGQRSCNSVPPRL